MSGDAAAATAAEPVSSDLVTVSVGEWDEPDTPQPRDWLQRPLIERLGATDEDDREPYRRMSTVAGTLTEQSALRTFLMRQLAMGLAKAPDLLAVIAGLDLASKGDRKVLDELIDTAGDRAGGKSKALWGTAVHRFTEPLAPRDWTPPDMVGDVESYWRETEARGIRRELSETFVVNDMFKCSGTFDGAFYVPGWSDGPDGGLVLGDVKTGGLHPGQHALQLAGYAGGVLYDHRKPLGQKRTALPRIRQDVGLLLHVPKGEADTVLYLIDLQAGREALELAQLVFAWRARKDLAQLFDSVPVPLIDAPAPQVTAESYHEQVVREFATAYADGGRVAVPHVEHPVAETVRDVNGNPVDLKGDGFDELRVSDPQPPARDPEHLIASHLGGHVLTVEELIASAPTEQALNRLWDEHRERWTPELTRLAKDRLTVLGVAGRA